MTPAKMKVEIPIETMSSTKVKPRCEEELALRMIVIVIEESVAGIPHVKNSGVDLAIDGGPLRGEGNLLHVGSAPGGIRNIPVDGEASAGNAR